jgi:hypothetical protein
MGTLYQFNLLLTRATIFPSVIRCTLTYDYVANLVVILTTVFFKFQVFLNQGPDIFVEDSAEDVITINNSASDTNSAGQLRKLSRVAAGVLQEVRTAHVSSIEEVHGEETTTSGSFVKYRHLYVDPQSKRLRYQPSL